MSVTLCWRRNVLVTSWNVSLTTMKSWWRFGLFGHHPASSTIIQKMSPGHLVTVTNIKTLSETSKIVTIFESLTSLSPNRIHWEWFLSTIWDQNLISKSFPSMSSPVESLQPELILSILGFFFMKMILSPWSLFHWNDIELQKTQNHYENVSLLAPFWQNSIFLLPF